MSTQEASSNERAVQVPSGWCWLRKDSPDGHTRQYWRDGKAFCLLAAQPINPGPGWTMLAYWDLGVSKTPSANLETMHVDESAALKAMDLVAIGIHATIAAQGIELACLNTAKGD
jgi:hypothetical protein